jgi:hypothetical protein
MAFFHVYWDVLKEDIMKVFHNFHARGKFERSINATCINIIPKQLVIVDINDFRPISLVGGVYKIIAICFSQ